MRTDLRRMIRDHAELFSAGSVSLVVLGLYVFTLAPGLTWRNLGGDGGDLLTAAYTWGIPHPSGYPTYLLGLRLFEAPLLGVDPAYAGNLFSAVAGALAVFFVFLSAVEIVGLTSIKRPAGRRATILAASVSALSVGVSRELWSQSTITEVYALNALFVAFLMWAVLKLSLRTDASTSTKSYWLLSVAFLGLGLGNHLTLAFVMIPMFAWGYLRWRRAAAPDADLKVALAFFLGLSVYLYAPFASLANPVLNWGHPHNADGFWWMISGSLYQDYQFGVSPSDIPERLFDLGDLILAQFNFVGLVIVIVGVTFLWESQRGQTVASLAGMILVTAYAVGYDTVDSFLYLIPLFVLGGIWMSAGVVVILTAGGRLAASIKPHGGTGIGEWAVTGLILVAIPGFSLTTNYSDLDLSDDRSAIEYATDALDQAEPGSIIAVSGPGEVFSLWYQSYVADRDADVLVVSISHLQFDWYWDDLKRQAPELFPDIRPSGYQNRVRELVDYNLGVRHVYAAGDVAFYDAEYTLTPVGRLFRILP